MNWAALILYLVGVPVAAAIDVACDPPPRRDGRGYDKRPAEVGFEIVVVAIMWPIALPFVALWGLFWLVGWAAGARR